uniref:AlNc14C72G4918 protein n=1 Tax=Albugo laibachii Nc14 TaxID=890382 RepID=F0WE59_9STRA|nr:AlNc14C72G4918 [Albugo laibachii Nc14]|eukprot:CCA19488.1 AlNc14C72G4918 [Albugo laibachii Nc14]
MTHFTKHTGTSNFDKSEYHSIFVTGFPKWAYYRSCLSGLTSSFIGEAAQAVELSALYFIRDRLARVFKFAIQNKSPGPSKSLWPPSTLFVLLGASGCVG